MCRESSMAHHQKRWVAQKSTVRLEIPLGLYYWLKSEYASEPNRKPIKHFFELFWEELKTGHKSEPKSKK
jgi:hypothetical protein